MQTVFALVRKEGTDGWLKREFALDVDSVEDALIWAGQADQLGGRRCVKGALVLAKFMARVSDRTT
jgi:hypothetical protein